MISRRRSLPSHYRFPAPFTRRDSMILRSTWSRWVFSSCSQILINCQPKALSSRPTFLSRLLFFSIFAVQNSRFVAGIERHRRQPCQKQPSKKIATRLPGKTTSGRPGRPESCPIFHPAMPHRIKSDRNLHSVDFVPFALFWRITWARVAPSYVSKMASLVFGSIALLSLRRD
jgi:hypothetical protein